MKSKSLLVSNILATIYTVVLTGLWILRWIGLSLVDGMKQFELAF